MDEDTPTDTRGSDHPNDPADRHDAGMADRMRRAREASQRGRIDNARRRAPKASVIRFALVITLAVASLGMVVYFTGTSAAHESAVRSNLSEIRELEKALAESEVGAESVPSADELRPAFSTAAAKGEELAAVQNDMADLNFEVRDRSAALGQYGGLVDEAKKFFTTGSLSGGAFLPHGQWYQPHEPGKNERGKAAWVRVPGDSWEWQSVPTKSVDNSGSINAVWTASFVGGEDDGMLLAWVTGKFDPQRGEFYDMRRGLTAEGNARLGATTSPPEDSSEESLVAAPNEKDLIDDALDAATASGSDNPTETTSSTPSPTQTDSADADSDAGATSAPTDEQDPEMADPGLDGAN